MYVLFKTDNWHSEESKILLAVATTKKDLIKLAREVAEQDEEDFTSENERQLRENLQTQGYGDMYHEFLAVEVRSNELVE